MHMREEIDRLSDQFEQCQTILLALGDENRFRLMIEMMRSGRCQGMRVNEIAEHSYLSRPAVSHHLKVLKDSGLLKVRREGTKNYYYFDPDQKSFDLLIDTLMRAREIAADLPNRSEEEE